MKSYGRIALHNDSAIPVQNCKIPDGFAFQGKRDEIIVIGGPHVCHDPVTESQGTEEQYPVFIQCFLSKVFSPANDFHGGDGQSHGQYDPGKDHEPDKEPVLGIHGHEQKFSLSGASQAMGRVTFIIIVI